MVCVNEKMKINPTSGIYVSPTFSIWCFHYRYLYTHTDTHTNVYSLQKYKSFHLLLKAGNLSWSETQWQKLSSWRSVCLVRTTKTCYGYQSAKNWLDTVIVYHCSREFFTRENLVRLIFPSSHGKSSKKY